jgi:hypothetical protein
VLSDLTWFHNIEHVADTIIVVTSTIEEVAAFGLSLAYHHKTCTSGSEIRKQEHAVIDLFIAFATRSILIGTGRISGTTCTRFVITISKRGITVLTRVMNNTQEVSEKGFVCAVLCILMRLAMVEGDNA